MALGAWALGALVAARRAGPATASRGAVARAGDALGPARGVRRWLLDGLEPPVRPRCTHARSATCATSLAAVLVPDRRAGRPRRSSSRRPRARIVVGPLTGRGPADRRRCSPVGGRSRPHGALATAAACGRCSRCRCWASRWPAVYAVMGAPDVALVAVAGRDRRDARLRRRLLARCRATGAATRRAATAAARRRGNVVGRRRRRRRRPSPSIWAALSRPTLGPSDAAEHIRADARGARRRRRDGHPRRLPRPRHHGRDHGRWPSPSSGSRSLLRRGRRLVSTRSSSVVAPRLLGPALMVAAAHHRQGLRRRRRRLQRRGHRRARRSRCATSCSGAERAERGLPILRRAPRRRGRRAAARARGRLRAGAVRRAAVHPPARGRASTSCTSARSSCTRAVAFDVGRVPARRRRARGRSSHHLLARSSAEPRRMKLVFALAAAVPVRHRRLPAAQPRSACASCWASSLISQAAVLTLIASSLIARRRADLPAAAAAGQRPAQPGDGADRASSSASR